MWTRLYLCVASVATAMVAAAPPLDTRKNVFLIIVDDLRPELLGAYSQPGLITPNLDRLANSSTVFERAYCQQAICGPTRNSFLSGRRPQRTQAWNFLDSFREAGPHWQSLPGYFKNQGYTTLGAGKTYHPGLPPHDDGGLSWTLDIPYYDLPDGGRCQSDYFSGNDSSMVCPDNSTDFESFTDFRNFLDIRGKLLYANLKREVTGAPFFLAYGIHKPHLPFRFPATFGGRNIWEAYGPTENISLPLHEDFPTGMPPIALPYCIDGQDQGCVFDHCYPVPGASLGCERCGPAFPDNVTRTLRKGYYAAVSWTDFLVGKVLDALDELQLTNDTVVAFIGDHGWQLGEHNVWSKQTNFELATRVPLMLRAAGQTTATRVPAIVESVDLYPTLAALAGLPVPPDVDGTDVSPMMHENWDKSNNPPFRTTKAVSAAFSEFPRCASPETPWDDDTACVSTHRTEFVIMGYSIRTLDWRCTLWMWWDAVALTGNFSAPPAAQELYLHNNDTENNFDAFENNNVCDSEPEVMRQCMDMARDHWDKNMSARHAFPV